MYDKSLVIEILTQIENAIKTTLQRFEVVDSVDYFTNTPQGMEKLDSICMQLIAIGESLKNIDKITDKKLNLSNTRDFTPKFPLVSQISFHSFH